MGEERIRAGIRETIVFDAGALIGAERGNPAIVDLAQTASELGIEILIPAAVLGQAWRGGGRSARLSILLAGSNVDALDEDRAKEVGVRLGERGGSDVADAHVVCCAIERDAMVLTSDPNDIAQLAEASEDLTVVSV